jgi:hypothetical protein
VEDDDLALGETVADLGLESAPLARLDDPLPHPAALDDEHTAKLSPAGA